MSQHRIGQEEWCMPKIPALGRHEQDGKFQPTWATQQDPASKTNKQTNKQTNPTHMIPQK
jgi:hypothetical protein